MWAVVSLTRARALSRGVGVVGGARAGGHDREDPRLELLHVEHHGHDDAHVVRVERRELGLERRLLDLDLGEPVAEPRRLAIGGGDQVAHAPEMMTGGGKRVVPGFVATNERYMPVPPEAVWDVLADPGGYGYWVVGSKQIRDAEPEWPAPGSKFHHTIGFGPFTLGDHTVALETERPHRFRLRAKGRPLGTATVTLEMTPQGRRHAGDDDREPRRRVRPARALPAVHLVTKGRNAESLMRLEELALRRA